MAAGFDDPRADLAGMTVREIAEELLAADARYPGCRLLLAAGPGKAYRMGFIGSTETLGDRQQDIVVILEPDESREG